VTETRFSAIADNILEGATRGGAGEAEAFFVHGRELTVKAFDGEVESLTSAEAQGVGVRVFTDSRMGFAYTSDLSDEGVRRVVAQALDACRYNEPDEYNGLPDSDGLDAMPELVAEDFDARSAEERVAMALELDALTAQADPAVHRTSGAVYQDERGRTELYNTRGLRAAFDATVAFAYVEAIAERGEENEDEIGCNGFPHSRMSPERARHYQERLDALMNEFIAEPFDPNGEVYGLGIAIFVAPGYLQHLPDGDPTDTGEPGEPGEEG